MTSAGTTKAVAATLVSLASSMSAAAATFVYVSNAEDGDIGAYRMNLATGELSAIVDDARVKHGVTAVEPIDPSRAAYRDVLVVTFKAQ